MVKGCTGDIPQEHIERKALSCVLARTGAMVGGEGGMLECVSKEDADIGVFPFQARSHFSCIAPFCSQPLRERVTSQSSSHFKFPDVAGSTWHAAYL